MVNVCRGPQAEILHAPLGKPLGNLSRADESYICPPRLSQFVYPEKEKNYMKSVPNFKEEVFSFFIIVKHLV